MASPHHAAATRWNTTRSRWETTARGREVLADPCINKGTAFTEAEREALDLVGLIPPRVLTRDPRAYAECLAQASHEYRRPRGVYLDCDRPEDIERSLALWARPVNRRRHRGHTRQAITDRGSRKPSRP